MNSIPEKYRNKPNLWRAVTEIAATENPEQVANALVSILAAYAGKESNAEKFNAALNSCQHKKAVYNMLLAFAKNSEEVAV